MQLMREKTRSMHRMKTAERVLKCIAWTRRDSRCEERILIATCVVMLWRPTHTPSRLTRDHPASLTPFKRHLKPSRIQSYDATMNV